jgi:hypothetical protein
MTEVMQRSGQRHIRTRVPSVRLLRAINPIVSAILKSPFHGLLSDSVMLLTFSGRKTGKRYSVPVGYIPDGDRFTVISVHRWWPNLRGGKPLTVRLRGREYSAHSEVMEDSTSVVQEVDRLVDRFGLGGASRRIGVALDITPPPTREEIAEAMRGRVMIRLTLELRPAGAAQL